MITIFFFIPHSSPFRMHIAEAAFQQAYPTFESTSVLDELRAAEYTRLDKLQQVYLDYTGGGLYAESQLHEHMELPCHSVFGNPHSTNPTSQAMTELVEHVRNYVLGYFHASPAEYMVIVAPDLCVNEVYLIYALDQARPGQYNLFAYPAQSNFAVCSSHWNGLKRPIQEAGICSWAALPMRPPIGWFSPNGIPILCRSRSTRERASTSSRCVGAAFVIPGQPKRLSMCQKQHS